MDTSIASRVIAAMDDFPFSLEDWVRDCSLVSRKAAVHVLSKEPGLQEDSVEGILEHLLRARSHDEMQASVKWIKEPSPANPTIAFDFQGTHVEGRCIIEPKRVHVSLLRDGKERWKETVMLNWAPMIYTEEPFIGSPANEDGVFAARRLLLSLYYEVLYGKA